MAVNAQFSAVVKLGTAPLATANALRDGTGAVATVLTAGSAGTRINAIKIKATATTTAGMIRLFINDGSFSRLLTEVPVAAVTPSATVATFEAALSEAAGALDIPLFLPAGHSLRASTERAETFNVVAFGGDF